MRNGNYNNKTKLLKIFLIFLVILLILSISVYSFIKYKIVSNNKNEIYQCISNNDLNYFLDNEYLGRFFDKMNSSNYSLSSNINLSSTMDNNYFSKLDLSKFNFTYNFKNDHKNLKSHSNLSIKYSENNFLNFDFLSNQNQFAIKLNDVNDRYIGFDKGNSDIILNKVITNSDILKIINNSSKFINTRENIDITKIKLKENYSNIIKNEFEKVDIDVEDNIVINQDNKNIDVKEYTIRFNSNQFSNMLNNLGNEVKNDDELIRLIINEKNLSSKISAKKNNANTTSFIWTDENANSIDVTNIINNNTNEIDHNIISNTNDSSTIINTNTVNIIANEISINNQNIINIIDSSEEVLVNQEEANTEDDIIEDNYSQEEINEMIQESDNLRLQGFISVDEDAEIDFYSDDDNMLITDNYEESLRNINNFIEKIDWKTYLLTGSKANISKEDFIKIIDNIVKKYQGSSLEVKLYLNEGKLIKVDFCVPEKDELLVIEIVSKSDTEKYLCFTYTYNEENMTKGRYISIYKKDSTSKKSYAFNLNKIINSKISQKININIDFNGGITDRKNSIDLNLCYADSKGKIKISSDNTINYNMEEEIEDLTEDNCIFIDNITDDEFNSLSEEVRNKMMNLIKQKNRDMNIIELSNSDNVIERNEQVNNDSETRDKTKEVLIKTIADKMGEYIEQGKNLTIQDLVDLKIDGYDVNVSISSNLAVIIVNGYKFNLDKDFNLSDA